MGNHLAVIAALCVHENDVRLRPVVHDGQLIEIFRLQREVLVHSIEMSVHNMQHALFEYGFPYCSRLPSTYNRSSEVVLFTRFDETERTFDRSADASFDIFPDTTHNFILQ